MVLTGHEFYSGPSASPSGRAGSAFQVVTGCSCAAELRYIGVHVVPTVDLLVRNVFREQFREQLLLAHLCVLSRQ